MSTRERSSSRRLPSSAAAASIASWRSGGSSRGAISPSGRTSTAPASSSRETALESLVWLSSVASWSAEGSTGPPASWTAS